MAPNFRDKKEIPTRMLMQKFHLVLNTDILEFICLEGEKDLPHLMTK